MTLDTQTAPAPAADTATLTIDQAVERQMARRKAPPEPVADDEPVPGTVDREESPEDEGEPVETQDSEADTQAADDGEEAPETDTLDAEQEQAPDPAEPKLEAPARWEAEDKALFATLPKKAQETILRREKLQQAEVTKAQQKSAEVAKTFETRIQHLNTIAETIGEYVDTGQARIEYWTNRMVEWDDWFASDDAQQMSQEDPGAYRANEARYRQELASANQDKRALDKAKADKAKAESEAFNAYVQEQARLIPELIPELVDEKEGPKRRSELNAYLREQGFEPDRIKGISAKEAQLVWKASQFDSVKDFAEIKRKADLYDKSMALAKTPPPPKPKDKAGPSAPAAGQGQTPSSSEARFKALSAKKSLTIDEAAEKAELRQKLRK